MSYVTSLKDMKKMKVFGPIRKDVNVEGEASQKLEAGNIVEQPEQRSEDDMFPNADVERALRQGSKLSASAQGESSMGSNDDVNIMIPVNRSRNITYTKSTKGNKWNPQRRQGIMFKF